MKGRALREAARRASGDEPRPSGRAGLAASPAVGDTSRIFPGLPAAWRTRLVPAVLAALALAGCGGGGGTTTGPDAASARWAHGLRQWGAGMRRAVNGLSVLFSRPADVRAIVANERRTALLLARYERTLAGCSAAVERLGAAPEPLALARREALHACDDLERAARLVRNGVRDLQQGRGTGLLNESAGPLGAGEDGVRRALLDARSPL